MAELMQQAFNTATGSTVPTLDTRAASLEKASTQISADRAKLEGEQSALNEQGVASAKARAAAAAPIVQKMQDAKPPSATLEQEKMPDYKRPTVDPKEFQDTFSTLMAMSMLVGLASRTPFYGAMNALTGAMTGYAKGDQQVVKESMDSFEKNYKAVAERNTARRDEYQAVWNKWKNDLPEMERQLKLSMYKFDDEDALRATQGKVIGDKLKYLTDREKGIEKSLDGVTRTIATLQEKEAARLEHNELVRSQQEATAEYRAAQLAQGDRRLDQSADRATMKAASAAQGGKPTQTERQHYVDSNQLLKSVDRITAMLKDPVLRKKIDDSRLGQVLSESVESKVIQQFAVRPNLDQDVKRYLNEVLMLRNQYYLDQSGKAVTGGEALRNYGAVVQPGDTTEDILLKMGVASERARAKMKDYETYFPSLGAINNRRAGDNGSPASFPRVAPAEQNRRDGDAMRIKRAELAEAETAVQNAPRNIPADAMRDLVRARDALRKEVGSAPAAPASTEGWSVVK